MSDVNDGGDNTATTGGDSTTTAGDSTTTTGDGSISSGGDAGSGDVHVGGTVSDVNVSSTSEAEVEVGTNVEKHSSAVIEVGNHLPAEVHVGNHLPAEVHVGNHLPIVSNIEGKSLLTGTDAGRTGSVESGRESASVMLNSQLEKTYNNPELSEQEKAGLIKSTVDSAIREIGRDKNMTAEEKVASINKLFDTLPQYARRDVLVPRDASVLSKEKPFDDGGQARYFYAENMGFDGNAEVTVLGKGTVIDRNGSPNGRYACEVVDGKSPTELERATPYRPNPEAHHQYTVVKDTTDLEQRLESLTVEDVLAIETERNSKLPEGERKSPDEVAQDAKMRFDTITSECKAAKGLLEHEAKGGWNKSPCACYKGKIAPCYSLTDENGNELKTGGGVQILLPVSVSTLEYMGYLEENK